MFAVQPLPWCPHLESVRPVPERGLDVEQACEECGDCTENWVCLQCYKVLQLANLRSLTFFQKYWQNYLIRHLVCEDHTENTACHQCYKILADLLN